MGKNRERAMILIKDFEDQITEAYKKVGGEKFTFGTRARIQLIDTARKRKISIEDLLAEIRPNIVEIATRKRDASDTPALYLEIFTAQPTKPTKPH